MEVSVEAAAPMDRKLNIARRARARKPRVRAARAPLSETPPRAPAGGSMSANRRRAATYPSALRMSAAAKSTTRAVLRKDRVIEV